MLQFLIFPAYHFPFVFNSKLHFLQYYFSWKLDNSDIGQWAGYSEMGDQSGLGPSKCDFFLGFPNNSKNVLRIEPSPAIPAVSKHKTNHLRPGHISCWNNKPFPKSKAEKRFWRQVIAKALRTCYHTWRVTNLDFEVYSKHFLKLKAFLKSTLIPEAVFH